MASEKRLTYVEDVIALFEKDIADSRDALKTAWPGGKEEIRAEMNGVRAALSILKHHASHGGTVDAVEVVRCKDCKHYTPVEGGKPLCALHSIPVAHDDFCSYGERKDNERKAD